MGAIVVSGLSSGTWAKAKPADYKGQELDKALKAYEAQAPKSILVPANLPKLPKAKIGEMETCIADLESAAGEIKKALAILKQNVAALKTVQGAAGKTAADLRKLAKDKPADKNKYENAASEADSIGSFAGHAINDFR